MIAAALLLLLRPPPHPIPANKIPTAITPRRCFLMRRRRGKPARKMPAKVNAPFSRHHPNPRSRSAAVCAAPVATVRVVLPLPVTEGGLKLQLAPAGSPVQEAGLKLTVPL